MNVLATDHEIGQTIYPKRTQSNLIFANASLLCLNYGN